MLRLCTAARTRAAPYALDKATIVTDLSAERPQWILSRAPGRNAPAQLFRTRRGNEVSKKCVSCIIWVWHQGIRNKLFVKTRQSCETYKWKTIIYRYKKRKSYFQAAEQQMQTVLSNVDQAIDFVISATKEHPQQDRHLSFVHCWPGRLELLKRTTPFARDGTRHKLTRLAHRQRLVLRLVLFPRFIDTETNPDSAGPPGFSSAVGQD